MCCYFDKNEIREFVRQLASEDEEITETAMDALCVSDSEVKVPLLLEIPPTSRDDVKEWKNVNYFILKVTQ